MVFAAMLSWQFFATSCQKKSPADIPVRAFETSEPYYVLKFVT
jgi:hypothetical protein